MGEDRSRFTVHLLGNAHIDLVYRWRLNEVVERVGPDTFKGVLDLMESDAEFTFVQSQMALYQATQQRHPDLFRRIEAAVAAGRWSVVGGWAEYDHMLTGDECIIRHYLLGRQFAQAQGWSGDMTVDWCPDSFSGHAHTLPTIMAGCGIRYLLMIRATPADKPAFVWEGPDGSTVLTCKAPLGYGIALSPAVTEMLPAWEETTGLTDVLVLYGMGDHGGGPRQGDLDALADMQAGEGSPRFVHTTALDFFQTLEQRMEEESERSGRSYHFCGELLDFSRGPFTSEARAKRQLRELEHRLLTAERLGVLSSLLQRKPVYPRVDYDAAWESVLRHTFHDDIPGTSRRPVYLDNAREYAELGRDLDELIATSMGELGARIDTRGDEVPVVVYNPTPWTRTAPAEVEFRLKRTPRRPVMVDEEGEVAAVQVLDQRVDGPWTRVKAVFVARSVPSLGFRLYRLQDGGGEEAATGLRAGVDALENQYLQVRLDPDTGDVASIEDKLRRGDVLQGRGNALQLLEEDPQYASAWVYWPTGEVERDWPRSELSLVERGPVRVTVSAKRWLRDSYVERLVTLYDGMPGVFFRTTCHWYERDAALKVAFPLALEAGVATYGVPFGCIAREAADEEVPAHRWVDVTGSKAGATLASRAVYGHDYHDGCLRLTLLRGIGDLDPNADEGEHVIEYALFPHGPDWTPAEGTRRGLEVNLPLVTRQEMKRSGVLSPWGAPGLKVALPESLALAQVEPANVVLTALKLEQGQWTKGALILRLYETDGKATTARISFPLDVALVQETDHLEEPKPEGRVRWSGSEAQVEFRPHEIRTVRIELAAYGLALDTERSGSARGLENG